MKFLGILVLINVTATVALFYFSVGPEEPWIAPLNEVSMILRLVVISAVIWFLEIMGVMGWRRGGRG